jgi:hypothetical protein
MDFVRGMGILPTWIRFIIIRTAQKSKSFFILRSKRRTKRPQKAAFFAFLSRNKKMEKFFEKFSKNY